jgi:hypothetical protein
MNMNNMISYLLIIILLSILCPRFTKNSLFFLISLIIIGYNITKNISMSVGVALFITYILVLLNNKTNSITENFKSKHSKKRKKNKKNKKAQIKETYDNEGSDKGEGDNEGDNEEDNEEDFNTFDSKESFLNNYKSMTPTQIKGLNKDTKQLIQTQKSLISTLNNMGPTLKEGKNILDTFKNYFGKDMDLKV